jgi:hypothetical protein
MGADEAEWIDPATIDNFITVALYGASIAPALTTNQPLDATILGVETTLAVDSIRKLVTAESRRRSELEAHRQDEHLRRMIEEAITSLPQVCDRLSEREAAYDGTFGAVLRALEADCDIAREWKASADAFLESRGGQ